MSSIDDHLELVAQAGNVCRSASLSAKRSQLGAIHQADADVAAWGKKIGGPAYDQIENARRELALAEFSASSGLYRQAYTSLRLFLELSFAAVHFSVNELERRQWMADRLDFSWSQSLSGETGLLTKNFVREFAPELVEAAHTYSLRAAATYRHCSQFVHGKAKNSNSLPQRLEYSDAVLSDWCEHAQTASGVVLFLLMVRYGDEFDAFSDAELQPIVNHHFGHIPIIQSLLGNQGV